MNEADIWKQVAWRVACFFRPPMPGYILDMIEKDVRNEMRELADFEKRTQQMGSAQ